jgi:hypothetical protein
MLELQQGVVSAGVPETLEPMRRGGSFNNHNENKTESNKITVLLDLQVVYKPVNPKAVTRNELYGNP